MNICDGLRSHTTETQKNSRTQKCIIIIDCSLYTVDGVNMKYHNILYFPKDYCTYSVALKLLEASLFAVPVHAR